MEHFIRIYDDVLQAEFCEQVIERFEADQNSFPGRCLGSDNCWEVNTSHKVTTELVISNHQAWRDVEDELKQKYIEYVNRYAEEFTDISAIASELTSERFRIKKYDNGGFFDWHIDCGGENFKRLLAIQFYFNDVHEGGDTEFEFQNVSVKSVQGRLVIFPTLWTYRHRGSKVISNPKYICTNYVRCNP